MAAALDLFHPIGPYTVGEWLDLPETVNGSRVELIYGYLHMSPAPSAKHQRAASRLTRLLEDALDVGNRADLEVLPALNVEISTAWRTALIPDVVVLTSGFTGVTAPPATVEMVVEIWSPGNNRAERETKLAAYASAGIQFLWTVDGDQLTTYRLVNGLYQVDQTACPGAEVTLTAAPVPVTLDVAQLSR